MRRRWFPPCVQTGRASRRYPPAAGRWRSSSAPHARVPTAGPLLAGRRCEQPPRRLRPPSPPATAPAAPAVKRRYARPQADGALQTGQAEHRDLHAVQAARACAQSGSVHPAAPGLGPEKRLADPQHVPGHRAVPHVGQGLAVAEPVALDPIDMLDPASAVAEAENSTKRSKPNGAAKARTRP